MGLGFSFVFASLGSLWGVLKSGQSDLFQVLLASGLGLGHRGVRSPVSLLLKRGSKTFPLLCLVVSKTLSHFLVRTFQNPLLPFKSFLIQSPTEQLKYMGSFLLSSVVRMSQAFWVVILAFLCYWRIAFKEVRENVISKVSIQKWKEKRKCH